MFNTNDLAQKLKDKIKEKLSSDEAENPKTDGSTATEETTTGNETESPESAQEEKTSILALIAGLGIFAWNSYVIFHNFSVHDGYSWAILAILVNLFIALAALGLQKPAPAINLGILCAVFIVAGIIGHESWEDVLAEQSVPIVNEILTEHLGKNASECTNIEITNQKNDGTYQATAFLDNGKTIKINIEYYKKSKQIEVSILR